MPNLSDNILGPMRRRRRATVAPKREAMKPEPSSAPAPPRPAPERRAEVEPEARPAERPEANTVRVLVVDPAKRSVTETRIATEPGDERNGYGVQVKESAVAKILGAEDVEWLDLRDGEVVIVDALRQSESEETWTFGEDGEPLSGKGVIVAHDAEADAYSDTALSLDEARKAVKWADDEDDEGARVELIAKIADRLEALDGKQLRQVQVTLDEIEGADGDAEIEEGMPQRQLMR